MFLLFDSKPVMAKVFIEMCILKLEELTLMEYASDSAPKIFFRSLNYVSFRLNYFFYLCHIVPDFIEKIKKETKTTLYRSIISSL